MSLTTDDLSPDQLDVYAVMYDWAAHHRSELLRVGGLAGTGKSTLLSLFVAARPVRTIAVVTFTGKASSVAAKKLRAAGVNIATECRDFHGENGIPVAGGPVFCGTIHSLCYRPILLPDGTVTGYVPRTKLDRKYDLICIDEASMVGGHLLEFLQSFDIPILAVGDHGQLPPVADESVLMESPDLRLEKIHRQAEKNPIIRLAHAVRQHGDDEDFYDWNDDDNICVRDRSEREEIIAAMYQGVSNRRLFDQAVIVSTNKARLRMNSVIRQALCRKGLKVGEQIICLRNQKPIFNGMRGLLETSAVPDDKYPWRHHAQVSFPDEELPAMPVGMFVKQFNRERLYSGPEEMQWDGIPVQSMEDAGGLFDFGYALTCWKAQGSQWRDVAVLVSGLQNMDAEMRARYLYTAVTRASERLTVLV